MLGVCGLSSSGMQLRIAFYLRIGNVTWPLRAKQYILKCCNKMYEYRSTE
jgi:hypothetical protein